MVWVLIKSFALNFQGVQDSRDLYDRIKKLNIWGRPLSRYSYSNTNYLLLGIVVEVVTGQDFESYLRQNIGIPAGMASSGLQFPLQGTPPGFAGGGGGDPRFPQESNAFPFSAGGLYTTVENLYSLDRALKDGRIVSQETLKTMMQDASGGYGLGFMTDRQRPYHTGVIDGYSAIWISSRPGQQDTCIIVFSNGGRGSMLARQFAEQLERQYF